ncbi:MAG: methionyl-tRNA formyltransferase, partial [Patescibacteria group bacterium]
MTIVFFGTPEFGAVVLGKLVEGGYSPELVVTVPDKPAGRGQLPVSPAVKTAADAYGISVLQTEDETIIQKRLQELRPDIIALASFGMLLPKELLQVPKYGALNVHPSLLPKYRGPSPVSSAILAGEKTTGVSIMLMDEFLDHGPVLSQRELPISEITTTPGLKVSLAELGGELLCEVIPCWIAGEITPQPQNNEAATFTKRLEKHDGKINWTRPAGYIGRQIRALAPWPGTYAFWGDKRLKVLEALALPHTLQVPPGQVLSLQEGTAVHTGE